MFSRWSLISKDRCQHLTPSGVAHDVRDFDTPENPILTICCATICCAPFAMFAARRTTRCTHPQSSRPFLLVGLFALPGEHHSAVVASVRRRLNRVLLGGLLFTLRRFGDGLFRCEVTPTRLLACDGSALPSELLLLGVDTFEGLVGRVERLAVAFFCFSERFGQPFVSFGGATSPALSPMFEDLRVALVPSLPRSVSGSGSSRI